MIKGITFDKQAFKSSEFALMTKKFFNNIDGRIRGVDITYTDTSIIISEGYFISSGYYTKIITEEIISVTNGTWTLVYEIDLSKTNTEEVFSQGSFKLINTAVIHNDLFDGETIYQLEFATCIMTDGVITDFESKLKDVTSDIFNQLDTKVDKVIGKELSSNDYTDIEKTKLTEISEGATKNEIAVIEGQVNLAANTDTALANDSMTQTTWSLDFPTGFTKDNCVMIAFGGMFYNDGRGYIYGRAENNSSIMVTGDIPRSCELGYSGDLTKIWCQAYNMATSDRVFYYKITLMKIM